MAMHHVRRASTTQAGQSSPPSQAVQAAAALCRVQAALHALVHDADHMRGTLSAGPQPRHLQTLVERQRLGTLQAAAHAPNTLRRGRPRVRHHACPRPERAACRCRLAPAVHPPERPPPAHRVPSLPAHQALRGGQGWGGATIGNALPRGTRGTSTRQRQRHAQHITCRGRTDNAATERGRSTVSNIRIRVGGRGSTRPTQKPTRTRSIHDASLAAETKRLQNGPGLAANERRKRHRKVASSSANRAGCRA